uniref:Uncharacterized protein n=1 Tax=Anguilla anguilla TaxID=7936 RepID=A0A0E9T920_ANGAN
MRINRRTTPYSLHCVGIRAAQQ